MLLCSPWRHLERFFLPGRSTAAWQVREQGLQALSMSFIQVDKDSDFPLQNLPYGVFSTKEEVSNNMRCIGAVVIVRSL